MASKWIKDLTNKLINELVEKHGFEINEDCTGIAIYIFNKEEVEIEQSKTEGSGFNRVRFNFNKGE